MTRSKLGFLAALLALGVAAAHLAWLWHQQLGAYASPDASGYFVQARYLAQDGRTWFATASPLQYLGIHMLEAPDGRFFSRYPPGMSALLAPVYRVGGYDAALFVNPILASLTLLFLFLLCRPWLGSWFALLATVMYAVNPIANRHALHADAHVPVTAFLVAGLFLLQLWARKPGIVRGLVAGLALGMVPTIRYPEAVVALGVVAFLAVHLWRDRSLWRKLPPLLTGAAIPVGAILVRNHFAFGKPWLTAYDLTNEQTGFSLDAFRDHAVPYLESLAGSGAGVFFGLGFAGFAAMLFARAMRPTGLLLLGATVPLTLVYMAYYWGTGTTAMRFFLPTLPLYVAGGFWLLSRAAVGAPRVAWPAAIALLALQGSSATLQSLDATATESEGSRPAAAIARWAVANIPEGSVVIADRRVLDFLDYVGRWKLVDAGTMTGRGRGIGRMPGRPGATGDRPSPMQVGRGAKQQARYAGLDPERRALRVSEDLTTWAGDSGIYWLGEQRDVDRYLDLVLFTDEIEKVGAIEMPQPRARGRRRGIMGGPPGGFGAPGGPPGGRRRRGVGGGGMFAIPNDGTPIDVFRWKR